MIGIQEDSPRSSQIGRTSHTDFDRRREPGRAEITGVGPSRGEDGDLRGTHLPCGPRGDSSPLPGNLATRSLSGPCHRPRGGCLAKPRPGQRAAAKSESGRRTPLTVVGTTGSGRSSRQSRERGVLDSAPGRLPNPRRHRGGASQTRGSAALRRLWHCGSPRRAQALLHNKG